MYLWCVFRGGGGRGDGSSASFFQLIECGLGTTSFFPLVQYIFLFFVFFFCCSINLFHGISLLIQKTFFPCFQGFKEFVVKDAVTAAKIAELRERVEAFSRRFSMPGFDDK